MRELWDRKYLPLLGYLILVIGILYALWAIQHQGATARERIAEESMKRDAAIKAEAARADAETERARKERVAMLNEINKQQCDEIEKLKKDARDLARKNWLQLDENGELLGIEITPALRAKAKEDYLDTLRRHKPGTCPRQILE